MKELTRLQEGEKITKKDDQIERLDDHYYHVKSQTSDQIYYVVLTELGWLCSCPDNTFRSVCCKHIHAVQFSIKIREKARHEVIIKPFSNKNCPACESSNIVKRGIRKNKACDIQRFYCNNCGKWFVFNLGFEKMRSSPQVITSAMQLYFTGESLRNVTKFLKFQNVEISHVTVYKWIKKYIGLMENYLDRITPQVGDKWRADELYLKVKGNRKYLYALLDDDTRFWIAKQVADTKYTQDVRPLFKQGKEFAQKRPLVLITDGAQNFQNAHRKEFWTNTNPRTKHIRDIHIKGGKNNNKMERLNGEIRDREKVMRGLKKMDTPIIEGYRIYHNYLRNHEGLGGKTPADVSGIKIEGNNKWVTLIQNASRK